MDNSLSNSCMWAGKKRRIRRRENQKHSYLQVHIQEHIYSHICKNKRRMFPKWTYSFSKLSESSSLTATPRTKGWASSQKWVQLMFCSFNLLFWWKHCFHQEALFNHQSKPEHSLYLTKIHIFPFESLVCFSLQYFQGWCHCIKLQESPHRKDWLYLEPQRPDQ